MKIELAKELLKKYGSSGTASILYLIGRFLEKRSVSFSDFFILLAIFYGVRAAKFLWDKYGSIILTDLDRIIFEGRYGKPWSPNEFIDWMTRKKFNPVLSCDESINEGNWRIFKIKAEEFLCRRKFCRIGPTGEVLIPPKFSKILPNRVKKFKSVRCLIREEETEENIIEIDKRSFVTTLRSWNIKEMILEALHNHGILAERASYILFNIRLILPQYRLLSVKIEPVRQENDILYLKAKYLGTYNFYLYNRRKKIYSKNICQAFENEGYFPPFVDRYDEDKIPANELDRIKLNNLKKIIVA